MGERENDIVIDSYYLINLFHNDSEGYRSVTQLHVQKMMFMFEAYYMNMRGVNQLYECQYQAWDFGPVATLLYKRYKNCGKDDIILTENEIEEGKNICEEKKKLLEEIYETFKNFSATQLVNFTHADGSPWKNAWNREKYSQISKKDMKDWFSQYVVRRD